MLTVKCRVWVDFKTGLIFVENICKHTSLKRNFGTVMYVEYDWFVGICLDRALEDDWLDRNCGEMGDMGDMGELWGRDWSCDVGHSTNRGTNHRVWERHVPRRKRVAPHFASICLSHTYPQLSVLGGEMVHLPCFVLTGNSQKGSCSPIMSLKRSCAIRSYLSVSVCLVAIFCVWNTFTLRVSMRWWSMDGAWYLSKIKNSFLSVSSVTEPWGWGWAYWGSWGKGGWVWVKCPDCMVENGHIDFYDNQYIPRASGVQFLWSSMDFSSIVIDLGYHDLRWELSCSPIIHHLERVCEKVRSARFRYTPPAPEYHRVGRFSCKKASNYETPMRGYHRIVVPAVDESRSGPRSDSREIVSGVSRVRRARFRFLAAAFVLLPLLSTCELRCFWCSMRIRLLVSFNAFMYLC